MELIDGQKVAKELLGEVRKEIYGLNKKNIQPKLVIISLGRDSASEIYMRKKREACEKIGIICEHRSENLSCDTQKLISNVETLNLDPSCHGILIQLPLPKHISLPLVIRAIDPKKDVDGFHAYNLGKMFLSVEFEYLVPCTPLGIIKLLDYYHVPVQGQNITVVGHSNIVGKPLSIMLLNRNATVTTCHIFTKNLKQHTLGADILIVAAGKPNLITADMVKDHAVIIDVGINRLANGTLCGDIDFSNVSKKARLITPVPGGVGPMTVACLMANVVKACKRLTQNS